MKLGPKVLAPVAVLAGAALVTAAMFALRRSAPSERPPASVPLVDVVRVEPETVGLWVTAQGTVEPRTESELVAEVSGRIVWVSPQLASGGFFDAGEELVRIDPRDYQVALDGARAALARAESQLELTSATLERQRSMRERGISSQARLDDAIHAQAAAEAGAREARVAVRRAQLDLERAHVRAPYAGRVREKHVDLGQFVSRGAPVARVFSVDYAEVRLPIRDADLAHLDLPPSFEDDAVVLEHGAAADAPGPVVHLSATVAGQPRLWQGRIVRSEGVRDARTRMLTLVAQVRDPYVRDGDPDRAPLPIGIFVEAQIEGRRVDGVFEVPRSALRRDDRVLVVDESDRVRIRAVEVLRSDRDRSWLRAGLAAGDRVVVSPLDLVTDGMAVRVRAAAPSAADAARDPVDTARARAAEASAPVSAP
ncbi:MAG TPA: efflux RND transporter periplasmic adaptor subunit [Myxococcota bacterium]|nr:efflux RND transporter periplasmic adaptor subunit [Myxococcota bacterium]